MAKRVPDREALIDRAHVESLRERLKLAEEVCILFGWLPARHRESEKDRLAHEAWSEWYEYVGAELAGPRANPRIDAQVTAVEQAT